MSSILKALKRLEEEKSKRPDMPVDIAKDILRQPSQRRKSTPRLLAAACGVVVAFGIIFLWYAEQTDKLTDHASRKEHVSTTPRLPPPPVAASVAETSVPPATNRPDAEVVEVRMTHTPLAAAVNPAADRRNDASARNATTAEKSSPPVSLAEQAPQAPPRHFVPQPRAGDPILIVSGIIFQPERETRLAIINDLPVMEGTHIEGAEVIEILADRVRFAWAGKFIEVELSKPQ